MMQRSIVLAVARERQRHAAEAEQLACERDAARHQLASTTEWVTGERARLIRERDQAYAHLDEFKSAVEARRAVEAELVEFYRARLEVVELGEKRVLH